MEKKKIGVVPLLYDEINYGGVLQFYAIQKVLINYGFEPEIIYVNDDYHFMAKYRENNQIKYLAKVLLKPYLNHKHSKSQNRINAVISERIRKTNVFKEKYYSTVVNFETRHEADYHAFLCGSDQIWNPSNARKRLFLDFCRPDTNKVIYAASLGTNYLNKSEIKLFKRYTKNIQNISIREKNGKDILTNSLQRDDIKWVLDPTLLLKPKDWLSIVHPINSKYHDSVFVYMLGNVNDYAKTCINNYALRNNKKIVRISYASGEKIDTEDYGDCQVNNIDPSEFLALIQNANCIFTDSFHACVFSILFRKKFYVFKRDGKMDMFDRLRTLFDSFDIPNDVILDGQDISYFDVDYTNIEEKQNLLINESLDYLINAINGKRG